MLQGIRPIRVLFAGTAWIAVATALPGLASAHGVEGDRFFPPTIATDDPFANDQFSTSFSSFKHPSNSYYPAARQIDVATEFDKEVAPNFALSLSETYINLQPDEGPIGSGFDNLTLGAKCQLYQDPAEEFIFSVGLGVNIGGTGSSTVDAVSFTTFTPSLYFGKGLGDLPEKLIFLRPIAVTGTVGETMPTRAIDPNMLHWGMAVEYSLPYLQAHVKNVRLARPFQEMIPLVEFSMETPENRGGGSTTGTINPGVIWESRYVQFGVEAMIPINDATARGVGGIFSVQIYIDDLLPRIFGRPIVEARKPADR